MPTFEDALSFSRDNGVIRKIGADDELDSAILKTLITGHSHEIASKRLIVVGLRLHNIALDDVNAAIDVEFRGCRVSGDSYLRRARLNSLRFRDCALRGVHARGLSLAGDFALHQFNPEGQDNLTLRYSCDLSQSVIGGSVEIYGYDCGRDMKADVSEGRPPQTGVQGAVLDFSRAAVAGDLAIGRKTIDGEQERERRPANATRFHLPVRLEAASVRGDLIFENARFEYDPNADLRWRAALSRAAIAADGLRLSGDLTFSDVETLGAIRLEAAEIGGEIKGRSLYVTMAPPDADAEAARAKGFGLELSNARIGRGLELTGTPKPPDAESLRYGRTTLIQGGVDLERATVEGRVSFSNVVLDAPRKPALRLDDATIFGAVRLDHETSLIGQLFMDRARLRAHCSIKGDQIVFDIGPGQERDSSNLVLSAKLAEVDGAIDVAPRAIGGAVDISGLSARLDVNFSRCDIQSTRARVGKPTIKARDVRVQGVFSIEGCCVEGGVDLSNLRARRVSLDFRKLFESKVDLEHAVLRLTRAEIGSVLELKGAVEGLVSLRAARCLEVAIDEGVWNARDRSSRVYFDLDGFAYQRIQENRAGGESTRDGLHLAWLKRDPEWRDERASRARRWFSRKARSFRPQPYHQLARVLRDMGHQGQARQVLVAMEQRRRATGRVPTMLRPLHWLYGLFAGYGHRLGSAALALTLAILIVSGGTLLAWRDGLMTPTAAEILISPEWSACSGEPNPAECWLANDVGRDYGAPSAFWYGVDVVVPLVELDQRARWAVSVARGGLLFDVASIPASAWIAKGVGFSWTPGVITWGGVAHSLQLVFTVIGWMISGFIVAGLSRTVMSD